MPTHLAPNRLALVGRKKRPRVEKALPLAAIRGMLCLAFGGRAGVGKRFERAFAHGLAVIAAQPHDVQRLGGVRLMGQPGAAARAAGLPLNDSAAKVGGEVAQRAADGLPLVGEDAGALALGEGVLVASPPLPGSAAAAAPAPLPRGAGAAEREAGPRRRAGGEKSTLGGGFARILCHG